MSWHTVSLIGSRGVLADSKLTPFFRLAYCELYIGVAAIVLRAMPSMALYKTTIVDIAYDHDEGLGKPVRGSKGLRIRMMDNSERKECFND